MKKHSYFILVFLLWWGMLAAQAPAPIDDPDITFDCPMDMVLTGQPGATTVTVDYDLPTPTTTCNVGGPSLPYCNSIPNYLYGYSFIGEYNGSKYFLSYYAADWHTANAHAVAQGGHLATVNSYQENNLIHSAMNYYSSSVWLGYNTVGTPGDFNWSNGEAGGYTNWAYGQPNGNGQNQAAYMRRYDGRWGDAHVSNWARYVIEIPCQSININGFAFLGEQNGSLYYKSNFQTTYTYARLYANAIGGDLVTINDAAENQFVRQAALGYSGGPAWIGLTNNNNGNNFEWESGEPVNYTNWRPGEPNEYNHYVGTRMIGNGKWTDRRANRHSFPFVVELPVPTTGGDPELMVEIISGPEAGTVLSTDKFSEVAVEITDACGNQEICVFEIYTEYVASTISELICFDDIIVETLPGETSATVAWTIPELTSDCYLGSTVNYIGTAPVGGGVFPIGTTTLTLAYEDSCGEMVECSFTVTVNAGIVDQDGDGVAEADDCDDMDATVGEAQPTGTPCDDGLAHTKDDTYQDDGCTCRGVEIFDACAEFTFDTESMTAVNLSSSANFWLRNSNDGTTIYLCGFGEAPCPDGDLTIPLENGTYAISYYDERPDRAYGCIGTSSTFTISETCSPGSNCALIFEESSFDENCNCVTTDTDGDGIIDRFDCEPTVPGTIESHYAIPQTPCNDGDPNTVDDRISNDGCSCVGRSPDDCIDQDGDGYCDVNDCDDNSFDETPIYGGVQNCTDANGESGILLNFGPSQCQCIAFVNITVFPPTTDAVAGGDATSSASAHTREGAIGRTNDAAFHIFPNPTSEGLNLDLSAFTGQRGTIEVLSMTGQLLQHQPVEELTLTPVQLVVDDLNKGVYLVSVRLENGAVLTKRFVKQ